MSSGTSHKMYDYEVSPPQGVWEKIEAELDESELSQKFPAALLNMQVNPPAYTWQKIVSALDEPALVNDYAAKLAGIAIAPPAAAWNKIQSALEPQPPQRMIVPWIKYAAAAVIIGFLAWGGVRLLNSTKNNPEIAGNTDNTPSEEHIPTGTGEEAVSIRDGEIAAADMNAAMEEARNDAALEASKKTYAKLDVSNKRTKVKNAADFFFVAEDYEYSSTGTTRRVDIYEEPPEETPPVDMASRYIVLMTPEGNIIRMSKKLRNLVCCVSGEEVDKDCIDQMKKWREKIASPSAAHTPGNFLDLLHMLNSMQDN